MEGAVALAESIFQTSVRLGIPEKFNGMESVLKNPIYATALGLVGFGFDQIKQGYTLENNKSFFDISQEFADTLKLGEEISLKDQEGITLAILIVEDINDSGSTLNWIKEDWESSCFPDQKDTWNVVWDKNVKFAVLLNNEASSFDGVDYQYESINKLEDPNIWIDFPWESWWLD